MSSLPPSLFEALYHTLAGEIEDYRQLVTLTQIERVALQNGNLADLMATVLGKESALNRLAQSEQARKRIMISLAEQFQLPASSLSDLISCCDEAVGQKLSALRQEFINLVKQLRALNQNNQLLLQTEVVRVNATLNFVLSTIAPDGQYAINSTGQATRLPVAGNVLNWQI